MLYINSDLFFAVNLSVGFLTFFSHIKKMMSNVCRNEGSTLRHVRWHLGSHVGGRKLAPTYNTHCYTYHQKILKTK